MGPLFLALMTTSAAASDVAAEPHLELSMGFHGGERTYADAPMRHTGDGADGLAAMRDPLLAWPTGRATVIGPRWESRVVLQPLRMTLGYQLAVPVYDTPQRGTTHRVGGEAVVVYPETVWAHEVRFGLGLEASRGPVAPFVDLTGDLLWLDTSLSIDGQTVAYEAMAFSLSARAGLRVHLRDHLFVEVAGERGLLGVSEWGAQLNVGFAVPLG